MKEQSKQIKVTVQTDARGTQEVLEPWVLWDEPETLEEALDVVGEEEVLRIVQTYLESMADVRVRAKVSAPYREATAQRMWERLERITESLEDEA